MRDVRHVQPGRGSGNSGAAAPRAGRARPRFRSADELAEALRATRAADATLSPPLRAWVRDVDRAGGEIGSAGAAVALALALGVLFQDIFPLPQLYLMLAVLLFTIGAARFGELVLRARAMLAEGLGHRAAARALELEEAAVQAEERVPIARRLPARTGATALLGAAKSGVLIWLVPRELPELVHLFVVAGSVVVPAAFLRRVWEDFNPESGVLARLMRGGLGRFTFAAARVGQRGLPEPLPVSEPTMLVLGRDVEELFRSLPASAREPVADIPATVALLRAEAQRLRAGGDARRLEQATAALETLRLELLRMHAGAGQVGELTLALERAREIGREVDRVEQARLEVESEATREAERTPR